MQRLQDQDTSDLQWNFPNLPPFPDDIPTAPLLRVSLARLQRADAQERERLWRACRELGFFYLDLRSGSGSSSSSEDERGGVAAVPANGIANGETQNIDGEALLRDADALFDLMPHFFALPVEEKTKYDFKDQGSYMGYKGIGAGLIDKAGNRDKNEFYNIAKNDILSINPPLPQPAVLQPHTALFKSFTTRSHAIVTLILSLLNTELGLPPDKLHELHRLEAPSGDQIRFVHAPPQRQPSEEREVALGEHTDFGSVTVLFNKLGGLQVLPPGPHARWMYVRPLPAHCVVNLGDAMVKFTAGLLRSNIHRVVAPPPPQHACARLSLVYFARPEDEVLLKRLRGSHLVDARWRSEGPEEREEDEEVLNSKDWVLRRALGRRAAGGFSFEDSEGTEKGSKMAR